MTDSHLKTFLRGSVLSLVGTGVLGVLNYLVRRYLSINLSPADYGTFYSTLALLMMVFSFSDLGLTQSGTALIAKNADTLQRDDCFNVLLLFKGTLSLLLLVGIIVCAPWISQKYLHTSVTLPLILLAVLMFFQAVDGSFKAFFNGLKKFGTLQIFYITNGLLLLLGVILLVKKFQLYGAVVTFLTTMIVLVLIELAVAIKKEKLKIFSRFSRTIAVDMAKLCGWVAVSTTLLTTVYYMDTVMLTAMKGVESAAYYNIALPIMQIVQALMIFPAVFLPIAMDLAKQKAYGKLRKFAEVAVIIVLVLAPVTYLFFAWSGEFLIKLLFDAKYVAATPAVPLLCCGLIFFTLGNFLLQILLALGKTKIMALISCIVAASNVYLNYIFIGRWDFVGAAGATLASYFIFSMVSVGILSWILIKKSASGQY